METTTNDTTKGKAKIERDIPNANAAPAEKIFLTERGGMTMVYIFFFLPSTVA